MKLAARGLQQVPYFRGRDRLKRSLLARSGHALVEVEGLHLDLDLSDAIAQHVYLNLRFPGAVWRLVRDLAQPGMTVVDVGANIGYVTLSAARSVGPQGRVLAFEPNRQAYEQLAGNIALNDVPWVVPERLACSDESGMLELYVPDVSSEYASLRPRSVGEGATHVERVGTVRLDELLDAPPDIVKIDVEGAEWSVLLGLGDLLGRCVLVLEASPDNAARFDYHPADMLAWLRKRGYELQTLSMDGLKPYADRDLDADGYSDVLCVPR